MPDNEYEIVHCEKIKHIHLFLVNINYRNPHVHKEIELSLVLEGNATVRLQNAAFSVSPGSVILINSNFSHEICAQGALPVLILSLQVSNHFCMEYLPHLRNMEFIPSDADINRALDGEQRRQLVRLMKSAARSYYHMDTANGYRCLGIVCHIFAFLFAHVPHCRIDEQDYGSRKEKAARLLRITDYIERHYQEKLLLRDIAQRERLTVSYLSHFFRENLNMTFQTYLGNIRFEKALQLMDNSSMRLMDICLESGFSDGKYLNHMFAKRFGCSPQEYRRGMHSGSKSSLVQPNLLMSQKLLPEEESLAIIEEHL